MFALRGSKSGPSIENDSCSEMMACAAPIWASPPNVERKCAWGEPLATRSPMNLSTCRLKLVRDLPTVLEKVIFPILRCAFFIFCPYAQASRPPWIVQNHWNVQRCSQVVRQARCQKRQHLLRLPPSAVRESGPEWFHWPTGWRIRG